jgi:hypothetical protein
VVLLDAVPPCQARARSMSPSEKPSEGCFNAVTAMWWWTSEVPDDPKHPVVPPTGRPERMAMA